MTERIEEPESIGPAPESIAVLRLGTLGDAILTTPLYAALRSLYPEAHISVIASEWNAVVPEHHAAVDRVIPISSGPGGIPRWLRTLFGHRFDMYVDPKDHRSTTSRIVAELIRAKRKLVSVGNLPMFSGADIVPPASGAHFVDSALAPMAVLAPDREFPSRPSLTIPESVSRAIAERLGGEDHDYVVVNVSTGSPTRRWPEEKWIAFVRAVKWDREIMVVSSPADAAVAERVAAVRSNARYVRTDSLMEAAALVGEARALITSDTSIVHIASAVNTPILALYFNAPVMMKKFAPLSDVQTVLVAPEEEPVSVIGVEEVVAAANALLEG